MFREYPPLIQSLKNPAFYHHPVTSIKILQTHISWIILTGSFAYKIKKPLDLGFLNFTTLQQRKYYCEEELRLNKRLAPQLYLDVISITGDEIHPLFNGSGVPFEYALKMVEFSQESRLDQMLMRGELKKEHIDDLAKILANFHNTAPIADKKLKFGEAKKVYEPIQNCFLQMQETLSAQDKPLLTELEQWSHAQHSLLVEEFQHRKQKGFIRECHGDAHLGNMCLFHHQVVLFDCIEFSESLRFIDVMNEIAFTVMDLEDRGASEFASRFLNRYLEYTGDYEGLKLLKFYKFYRALVRAKISSIRASQIDLQDAETKQLREESLQYLMLAKNYTIKNKPKLYITHGLSGSGKTFLSQSLLEKINAIRIRTDVERKRLFGLSMDQQSTTELKKSMYSVEASKKTYQKIRDLSKVVLESGFSVIVDGTFLKVWHRDLFKELAEQLHLPFMILDFHSEDSDLRKRISHRVSQEQDASEATIEILESQIKSQELLTKSERDCSVSIANLKDLKKLI